MDGHTAPCPLRAGAEIRLTALSAASQKPQARLGRPGTAEGARGERRQSSLLPRRSPWTGAAGPARLQPVREEETAAAPQGPLPATGLAFGLSSGPPEMPRP